jgi:hypothetical protein
MDSEELKGLGRILTATLASCLGIILLVLAFLWGVAAIAKWLFT